MMIQLLQDVHKMLLGATASPNSPPLPEPNKLLHLRASRFWQLLMFSFPSRAPRRESTSSTHVGRGGAANVFKPTAEEIEKAKKDNTKWESAVADDDNVKGAEGHKKPRGLADQGKEWLFGRK
jgi:hypothetical protein